MQYKRISADCYLDMIWLPPAHFTSEASRKFNNRMPFVSEGANGKEWVACNGAFNVAVCDAGGRLLAFQRMDGAMWAGSLGSQGKAMVSSAFGRPSDDLTTRADHPILPGVTAAEGNNMFYRQGVVPTFRDGVLSGACGVGGGFAREDEDCTRAGVDEL
jgi:uncharacterized protein GlcG (DUF336 family)